MGIPFLSKADRFCCTNCPRGPSLLTKSVRGAPVLVADQFCCERYPGLGWWLPRPPAVSGSTENEVGGTSRDYDTVEGVASTPVSRPPHQASGDYPALVWSGMK